MLQKKVECFKKNYRDSVPFYIFIYTLYLFQKKQCNTCISEIIYIYIYINKFINIYNYIQTLNCFQLSAFQIIYILLSVQ